MKTTLITLLATLLVTLATTLPSVSQEPTKPESGKPAQTETAKATLPVTRTITDTKGRTMEGTILSKSDTAIKFRRASDNKEFEINIDTLSDADKTFVAGVHTPPPPRPNPIGNTRWFVDPPLRNLCLVPCRGHHLRDLRHRH